MPNLTSIIGSGPELPHFDIDGRTEVLIKAGIYIYIANIITNGAMVEKLLLLNDLNYASKKSGFLVNMFLKY